MTRNIFKGMALLEQSVHRAQPVATVHEILRPGSGLPSTRLKLYGQYDFDAHVLTLIHELTINDLLVGSDAVTRCVCWICGRGNLNFAPFTITGHNLAVRRKLLEAFVDALFLDAALALDKGRFFCSDEELAHEELKKKA